MSFVFLLSFLAPIFIAAGFFIALGLYAAATHILKLGVRPTNENGEYKKDVTLRAIILIFSFFAGAAIGGSLFGIFNFILFGVRNFF